jgi:hypothetical protein
VDKDTIEVLTLPDRQRKIVAGGGLYPRYLPTSGRVGHLVYLNKGTLFAVPFDLDKLETRGTAVPVLDDVGYDSTTGGSGLFDFSLGPSGHGTLVYRRTGGVASAAQATLQWVDPAGRKELLRTRRGDYVEPSLSPDGKRVALRAVEGGSSYLGVYDSQRDAMTRLTFGSEIYVNPLWSPDGQFVVFASPGNGIFQTRADGASQPQALTQSKIIQHRALSRRMASVWLTSSTTGD